MILRGATNSDMYLSQHIQAFAQTGRYISTHQLIAGKTKFLNCISRLSVSVCAVGANFVSSHSLEPPAVFHFTQ